MYSVDLKVSELKPDKDSLFFLRRSGAESSEFGDSLADSLYYTGNARVARDIMPYEMGKTGLKKGDEADSSVPPAAADGKKKSWEREYDEVVAKYKGTDKWLKAPNGEPTNLTERQWVQVRTPSFKAWFGDWEKDPANASKVIDSNGEPMVVYRGSPEKMGDVFEYGHNFYGGNKGFWFTNSKSGAETYAFNDDTGEKGEVKEVFLNARNIVDLVPLGINTTSRRLCDFVRDIYGIDIGRGSSKAERINDIYERIQDRLYPGSHDGIRLADVGHTYIVKTPTQIKSATDNSGAFSPEKENIMDGAADAPRKPSLRDIAAAALAEDR